MEDESGRGSSASTGGPVCFNFDFLTDPSEKAMAVVLSAWIVNGGSIWYPISSQM